MRDDLQPLMQRIAEIEAQSGPRLSPLASRPSNAWDEILLGGKLSGALVELLEAEEGMGAWTLALCMARHACGDHKVLVVVDGEGRFYPPAAAQWNIDLRRTIVVRPREEQSALTALTQSLRWPPWERSWPSWIGSRPPIAGGSKWPPKPAAASASWCARQPL